MHTTFSTSRRQRLRVAGALSAAVAVALATIVVPPGADADHAALHACGVEAAPARFPAGFTPPDDEECGYPLGGFGGVLDDDAEWGVVAPDPPDEHHPVVFVHGNVVDHADWYPVRDQMIAMGWDAGDLWAMSFNGEGNNSGSAGGTPNPRRDAEHADDDGLARNTSNEINAAEVARFISAVADFTGDHRVSIVGHSLGVTLARRSLELLADPDSPVHDPAIDLVVFVGIAGGNHGTSLCPPGSGAPLDEDGDHLLNSCDELEMGSAWLAALNESASEFGDAVVMSVYDGTGAADVAYLTAVYAESPRLSDVVPAALDCAYPGRGHSDLRLSAGIVAGYVSVIEAAEAHADDPVGVPAPTTCPADPLGLR